MKIKKIKKKILLSILIIIILAIIGCSVFYIKKYYNTDNGKTKVYAKELSHISLTKENKEIISIIKEDINNDEIEDYIVLLGEPKYEEIDISKVKILQALSSELEMYNNVSVTFVDGSLVENEDSCKVYNTNKTYGTDVNLEITKHNDKTYIKVSDGSGNIALLYLGKENLKNIITNTIEDKDFVGYTIEGSFKDDNGVKLVVTLDNYGKDYLKKVTDKFTLDYKDTDVNEENYRLTYMANKFSNFEFVENEEKSKLYLKCVQYILYSNNGELNKNEGFINTKFEITDENKLKFSDVEVVK